MDILKAFVVVLVIMSIPLGLLVIIGTSIDKSNTRKSCDVFGVISGYETKYVEYTYWNFDCLAKTENGKWLSTSSLREDQ